MLKNKVATPKDKAASPKDKAATPKTKIAAVKNKVATAVTKAATPKNKVATAPKKAAAPEDRVATPQASGPNPFLDNEFYARMRAYTDRDPAIVKELKAIAERGAGRLSPDPRQAPSLKLLRAIVKKGVSLEQMFERIAAGTEKALWLAWMEVFGFELRKVSYAPDAPRNACLALDLGLGSKAHALFAGAGLPNWRSHAIEDCAQLQVSKVEETGQITAWAIFYLDPAR